MFSCVPAGTPPHNRHNPSLVVGCAFWLKHGYCQKGEQCEFSHSASARPQPCRFYSVGVGCMYGASCRFLHVEQKTVLWTCPAIDAGWMIGKEGVVMNSIRRESAATIRSTNAGDGNVTFVLSGAAASVDIAQRLMNHRHAEKLQAREPKRSRKRGRDDDDDDGRPARRSKVIPEKHRKALAKAARGKKVRCPTCSKMFKTVEGLVSHSRDKHPFSNYAALFQRGGLSTPPSFQQQQPPPPPHRTPPFHGGVDYDDDNYEEDSRDDESIGPFGFSRGDEEELLAQGVKPWDDDAAGVLAAMYDY